MFIAIRCGLLIDGHGGDPLRDAAVVIEDGVITAVNANGSIPKGAEVIDASEHTVMPGMIDCHVHIMSTPRPVQDRLLIPPSLSVAEGLRNARTTLASGFTSVRDAGGTPRGVKMAIDQGLFPGPRVRIAVSALSQTGGHGDGIMPSGVQMRVGDVERPVSVVDGVEGARKATREILRAGADQIKVMTSGGVLSVNDEPGATGFAPDEIEAIVYEAHAAGKTVMSHAQATQGIKNAVSAGIESIEHGIYLDDEVIEAMKRQGTYLVATLVAPMWVLRRAEESPGAMPPYAVRKTKEVLEVHRASFKAAAEAGVRIAMGTDSGVGYHGSNAEELALMVELGLTPMEAIVATTKAAAECSRIDHLTGTIEVGKAADVLAVNGDPLSDIGILQDGEQLALIMKGGEAFKNELS